MDIKIKSFTDLITWQKAHQLVIAIYKVTCLFPSKETYSLVDQMRRAATSITSNIAEGFGRHSYKEKVQFYYLAHGSLTELENQLLIAKDVGYMNRASFTPISEQANEVHRLLLGLIKKSKSLKSEICNLKSIIILLIPLLILKSEILNPKSVSAQTFDLSVSPPLTHILIKPDTSIIQTFNITNHANNPTTLTARLVPFTPGSLSGIAELNFDSNPKYLDYFTLANANIALNQPFTIQANGSDQLVLMIKFPKNADLADYYTSLVISQASPDPDKLTGTYLTGAVIANILTTVNLTDSPDVNLSLSDLTVEPSLFQIGPYHIVDTLSPVSFTVVAKNRSPFLTTTTGSFSLTIKNKTHLTAGLKPIYLLAYSERTLESSDSAGFIYHPNLFTLGPSTATFTLDQKSTPATATIKLFFFPIKIIFSLILLLCFFTFIFSPLRPKKLTGFSLDTTKK